MSILLNIIMKINNNKIIIIVLIKNNQNNNKVIIKIKMIHKLIQNNHKFKNKFKKYGIKKIQNQYK